MARSMIMGLDSSLRRHGAHSHLLPHRRHRSLGRVLRGAGLRGAPARADPRGGDQRLHGRSRRRRPPRVDAQLRRGLLRARHGLQPHRGDGRRPRRDAGRPGREGHRARETAVPGTRGRVADLLRPRSRRLPDRAHRARLMFQVVVEEGSEEILFMPEATAADWAQVFAVAEVRRVGAGLAVVQAGEEERALYLLTEGTLGVRLPRAESAFKTIDAPAVVGEVAFFDALPRSATLEAVTDVEVVRLAPEDLEKLDPALERAFLHALARVLALRLRLSDDVIASLRE